MRTFTRRNRTLAPPPDAEPVASTAAIYIGKDWKQVVAAWPEPMRRRHAEIAAGLHAKGWQADPAAYLAYERLSEGNES